MKKSLQDKFLFIILSSFSFLIAVKTIAQEGTIDLSFGDSGKAITQIEPSYNNIVRAVVTQVDKKILVMSANSDVPSSFYTKIVRYKANGAIDSSFGENGILLIDSISGFDLKLTSSGKMLLYGQAISYFYKLLCLNKNGTIDYSFADNGSFSFFIDSAYPPGGSLVIDTNNKILVTVPGLAILRLTSSGKIDSSFGVNGFTRTNGKLGPGLNYFYQITHSLAIESNNNIIAGGSISDYGTDFQFAVVRYTADGIIDSSFGTNGLVISTFAKDTINDDEINTLNNIAIQSGNKILIGGHVYYHSTLQPQSILVRLNDNGLYDSTFGNDGKAVLGDSNVQIGFILLQNDNKIIASGTTKGTTGFVLERLLPDGKIDSTFGINGFTITLFNGYYATARSLCFQDENIIAAGNLIVDTFTSCAVVRYKNENVLSVSLLSFTAHKNFNSVILNWQTTNEGNNNYFVLQKVDANNNYWNILATIPAKESSYQKQSYSFEDMHPSEDINYYRLKQIDNNGQTTYSKIVSVDFEKGNIITIFPNPVSNILNIKGLGAAQSNTLIITDQKGNTIEKLIVNSASYSLDIKDLSKGFYFIKVIGNDKTSTIKFVKN